MGWRRAARSVTSGLGVYEEEEQIFFEDRSGLTLSDDVFARLLTFQMSSSSGTRLSSRAKHY
jgi:hypothetical protein